jgi:hypothetical protein
MTKQKSIDWPKAKRSPVRFVSDVLQFRLHDYQRQILEATEKWASVVFVGGRGVGKTAVSAQLTLFKCITEPKHVVVYVSGRMGQSKVAQRVLLNMCEGTPLYISIAEKSDERILFDNGSIAYYLPNTEAAVRGFHNVWVREGQTAPSITLVVDEAAIVAEDTFNAALGVLNTAEDSTLFVCGSPLGRNSWFYKMYAQGLEINDQVKSFQVSAEGIPHIDPQRNAEFKEIMDTIVYGAEIQAKFQESLDSFFTEAMIKTATQPYKIPLDSCDGKPPKPRKFINSMGALVRQRPGSEWSFIVSLDLSSSHCVGSDFTVITILGVNREVDPPLFKVFDIRRFQVLTQSELERELTDVCKEYPELRVGVVESYEAMCLESVVKYIKRPGTDKKYYRVGGSGKLALTMYVVNVSNELKREAFAGLQQLMRDGQLHIPQDGRNADVLRQELRTLTYHITEGGRVTYSAMGGKKDDCVHSLLWASYYVRRARGIGSPGVHVVYKPEY